LSNRMVMNETEKYFVTQMGGVSLLQSRPCLVGDFLAIATGNSIRIYSVYTSSFVSSLEGHFDMVTSVLPHPLNPLQLISSSLDGTVRFWSVDDAILLKTIDLSQSTHRTSDFTGDLSSVNGIKATQKAIYVILNGDFCRIPYPDSDSKKEFRENAQLLYPAAVDQSEKNVEKLWALSGKGTRAAFLHQNRLKVFHIKTRKVRAIHLSEKFGPPLSVAYHPKEESILTTHKSGMIRIHSNFTRDQDQVSAMRDHWHSPDQPTMDAAFSTDGTSILSGGQEAVFVLNNWRSMEKNSQTFLPRLGGPIVWVANFDEWTLLSMADNSILIVQDMNIVKRISGFSQNIFNAYPAGLGFERKTKTIIANGKAGTLQLYDIETDRAVSVVDVTDENLVITSGTHSNAAQVVLVDSMGDKMVTVERKDDGFTRPRDTIRIWKYEAERWHQRAYIDRSHVGIISHVQLMSEKCFLSSGVDAKLKMWEESDTTWVTTSVAGYRTDPIEHFDISEDMSIVTTVQGDKCCIFNAIGLHFTDTLLPPPDSLKRLERVFHGRGLDSHLLLVSKPDGFLVWDLKSCSILRHVSQLSQFMCWRSLSSRLFCAKYYHGEVYKIAVFGATDKSAMIEADSKVDVISACFAPKVASEKTDEDKTQTKFENEKLCLLTRNGSLATLSSNAKFKEIQKSCVPSVRLENSKILTPVGGLLSELPPETQQERKEKIKINNKKLSDLLFLPAYLLPKASDYSRKILSVLSENKDLAGKEMPPKEEVQKMEVDESEEEEENDISQSKPGFEILAIDPREIERNQNVFDGIWAEVQFE